MRITKRVLYHVWPASCNTQKLAACKTLGFQRALVFAQFGLLVKQALYFDRYTKLLAPDLDLVRDYRVVGLDDARAGAIDVCCNFVFVYKPGGVYKPTLHN